MMNVSDKSNLDLGTPCKPRELAVNPLRDFSLLKDLASSHAKSQCQCNEPQYWVLEPNITQMCSLSIFHLAEQDAI